MVITYCHVKKAKAQRTCTRLLNKHLLNPIAALQTGARRKGLKGKGDVLEKGKN